MNDPRSQSPGSMSSARPLHVATLLQHHHAQCEMNFLLLQRVLPDFNAGTRLAIDCASSAQSAQHVQLELRERSRYTALLSVVQQFPVWGERRIELLVRVYLDVAMAEVVACPPSITRLLARYVYPNPRMLAHDEKWQLNRLLGEWLSCCLQWGHRADVRVFLAAD